MAWREQRWTRCACSGYCGDVAHCSGYCGDGATCGSSAVPAFPPLIISNYGDRHSYLPFHCFHCHHQPSLLRSRLICPFKEMKCQHLVKLKGRIQLRSKLFKGPLFPTTSLSVSSHNKPLIQIPQQRPKTLFLKL